MEEAKYIKNIAGGRFMQIGSSGGVNNDMSQPRKEVLRVLKVDGPFDPETGEKVDIIEKEKRYNYRIVQYSRTPTKQCFFWQIFKAMKKIYTVVLLTIISAFIFFGVHTLLVIVLELNFDFQKKTIDWGIFNHYYVLFIFPLAMLATNLILFNKKKICKYLPLSAVFAFLILEYFSIRPYRTILLIFCSSLTFLLNLSMSKKLIKLWFDFFKKKPIYCKKNITVTTVGFYPITPTGPSWWAACSMGKWRWAAAWTTTCAPSRQKAASRSWWTATRRALPS